MLTSEKKQQIENELEKFDLDTHTINQALNLEKSSLINELVEKIASLLTTTFVLIAVYLHGGVWGKAAMGCYAISQIALGLKTWDSYRAAKKMAKEFDRFVGQLKDKGITLDDK